MNSPHAPDRGRGPRLTPGEQQSRYNPTEEEKKALGECRRESFWYRSFPFAVVGAVVTQVMVQRNVLTGGRFGSLPKVFFAGFSGYILGKISYIGACKQKIMQLENSPMGKMLREGNMQGFSGPSGAYEEVSEPEPEFTSGNSGYKNIDDHVNLDIDTSGSKLSDDFDVAKLIAHEEEEKLKLPEMTKTYDQLRKESRSRNNQVPMGQFKPGQDPRDQPHAKQTPSVKKVHERDEFSLGRSKKMRRNEYGDLVYDE